jgi:hypothetical protein
VKDSKKDYLAMIEEVRKGAPEIFDAMVNRGKSVRLDQSLKEAKDAAERAGAEVTRSGRNILNAFDPSK